MTLRRVTAGALEDMLRNRPVTAARCGFLTLLDELLEVADLEVERMALAKAARKLCDELNVGDVRRIGRALSTGPSRAPRAIVRMFGDAEVIAALSAALSALGRDDLVPELTAWAYGDHREVELPARSLDDAERRELVDALLLRADVIAQAVKNRTGGLRWKDVPVVDGRSLKPAGAAWQMPNILGRALPVPGEHAARYGNRVGRSGAVLAVARARAALRSSAPDAMAVEPILLLMAVAETITPTDVADPNAITLAGQGRLRPRIRAGAPHDDFLSIQHVWNVLDCWGNTSKRKVSVIPTAWNLPPVWADVLVWAVCSAAARLAVASEFRSYDEDGRRVAVPWETHLAAEWPKWESGARSAWLLMQSGRSQVDRTAWPGCLTPALTDSGTWPWRAEQDPWADGENGPGGGGVATVTPIGMR